ncbi:MAG: hypothetical protein H6550_13625 [Chitinophagales bacterium]|nr:hypothetical protein [Chitinophagales bacterium]
MSTTNLVNLGEIPVCSIAVILPVTATDTGTWAFMTTFNGAYQYIQFTATQGENIVVPAVLNEDYNYTFKLYKPDNTILNDTNYCAKTIPILPGTDYVCPAVVGDGVPFTTGKIEFVATEGQAEASYVQLTNAKQVVVFIEGAIRQEGAGDEAYIFSQPDTTITFNTPLMEGQKITIIYFK